MNDFLLSEEDFEIWLMWKHSFKTIFDRIFDDVDISDGDFMVLELLTRSVDGKLRQQEIANTIDWTKSRLSHHLSRMEKRDLVIRKPLDNEKGVNVVITQNGRNVFNAALPQLSKNVKKHFIDQLTEQDKTSIRRLADKSKIIAKQ